MLRMRILSFRVFYKLFAELNELWQKGSIAVREIVKKIKICHVMTATISITYDYIIPLTIYHVCSAFNKFPENSV